MWRQPWSAPSRNGWLGLLSRRTATRRAAIQRFFDRVSQMPVLDARSARDRGLRPRRIAFLMVLDTSAIIAAIAREPDVIRFQNATLGAACHVRVSTEQAALNNGGF